MKKENKILSTTSIKFKPKSYEEIFYSLLQNAFDEGLLSSDTHFMDYVKGKKDIENVIIMKLSIYATEIKKAYDEMSLIVNGYDIDIATDYELDLIGKNLGINRPSATAPIVKVQFSIESQVDFNISIPENIIIATNDESIAYHTVESSIIYAGDLTTTVSAISNKKGKEGIVNSGELTKIITSLSSKKKLYVTNPTSSSGGYEEADNETYRSILKNWSTTVKRGTLNAFMNYLDSVDGLEGYSIVPLWDDTGTIAVIIDPDNDYLVKKITEELLENVQSFDDDVWVLGATPISISLDCYVNVSIDNANEYSDEEKQEIQQRVLYALKLYIDGGKYQDKKYSGLQIGEDFIPFKAGIFINNIVPEVQDVWFATDIYAEILDDGTVVDRDYIPILDYQIATTGSGYVEKENGDLEAVDEGIINIIMD